MGLLQQGKWVDQWYQTDKSGGKFVREDAKLRNWITPDAVRAPVAKADSRPSRAAIISMFHSLAPGPTEP